MSTIRVVNLQHTDATEPNIVLESDGTAVFASGITISGGTNLTVSGTAEFASGTVSAPGITFIDDNNTGIYEPAVDTVAITTSGTERLRVDSSGNVGIGTGSPRGIVHVGADLASGATDAAAINIKQTSTTKSTGIYLERSTDRRGHYIYISSTDDALTFERNNLGTSAVTMVMNREGNVGIGTASPGAPLDVVGGNAADLNNPAVFIENNKFLTLRQSSGNWGMGLLVNSSNDSLIAGLNNLTFNTGASATERMRIDSSGRILIGTSSIIGDTTKDSYYAKVTVLGRGDTTGQEGRIALIRDETASNITSGETVGNIFFSDADGNSYANIEAKADANASGSATPGRLSFHTTTATATNPTERIRISNTGQTGLLFSSTYGHVSYSSQGSSSSVYTFWSGHSATDTTGAGGTHTFRVASNGDVKNITGTIGTISDSKLKENIVDVGSQWKDLKAVRFRKYNFKEETGYDTHTQLGVIAQELEEVCPGLVEDIPDIDMEGNDLGTTTKNVKTSILTLKALVALQEAMGRIETLEAKVAAFEAS